jgi:predicted dehydrogenase
MAAVSDVTPQVDPTVDPDGRDAPVTGPLRVGIVGGGFMGRVHARSARVAGAEVVAAVGSSPARSAKAAEAVGAGAAYDDVGEMLRHADVDVVHVCTPNHSHLAISLAVLEAGRHVVCEKPLATSTADAERLQQAAREAGLVATVPFVYRYHPMVREMRSRIRAGHPGQISTVHGSYLQDWLSGPDDQNWRVDHRAGGPSRAFADIGSHWCDLAEFVTGDRIERLSARTRTIREHRGANSRVLTEDLATAQFTTASGVLGTVVVSQVAAGRKNRLYLEVSGTEASLGFDQEDPERLWVGRRDETRLLVRDPETLSEDANRISRLPAGHAQGYQDAFDAFVADTYAAVRGAPMPDGVPSFDDGARSARIIDAVLRSAADDGAWTEV